jgi:hypothetical protein
MNYFPLSSSMGALHLTEIPEILLENQMEHVNFWNDSGMDLSKISRGCPQIGNSGNFEFFTPLKHFPTTLLLSSLPRAKTATKTAGFRPFQCLESGFISPDAERRDSSGSVKFFKIKETAFQKLTCSI